jgi:hypothetical protein
VRAVEGRFAFFGYPEVRLERPLALSRDPFTGRLWPSHYGPRIDYRTSAAGDPKWIWELNRCQHLPLLLQATLISDDDRFARCAVADLDDWLRQDVPGRGIAWANAFEPSLRAISFAVCFDSLRGTDLLGLERAERLAVSLWQHVQWIRREPSTHSSANNHRIAELVSVNVVTLLVPELCQASTWQAEALRELEHEVSRQIRSDGTSVEQAFGYHLFVLDLLLLVAAVLAARSRPVPESIAAALERSAEALVLQLDDSDPVPAYGDSDDGRALNLDGLELRDPRGVAASLAALLGHSGARRVANELDTTALWLFGAEGAERFDATAPDAPAASGILPGGGLIVIRRDGRRVLFDVGPLGYGSLAAHGHADALQLTVADDGEDLIVDPGVGSYFAHPEWRRAFRGTSFHPTVTVDGVDQSQAGGPFLWQRHASARVLAVDLEQGFAVGEHDGYRRLADPVSHRRAAFAPREGPLVVVDALDASRRHTYTQVWPLHPGLEATVAADGVVHATAGGAPRLVIAFAAVGASGRVELVRGEDEPFRGWFSPRLEARMPAWHCSWSAQATSMTLVAVLWPLQDPQWPDFELSASRIGETVSIGLRMAEDERRLVVPVSPGFTPEDSRFVRRTEVAP